MESRCTCRPTLHVRGDKKPKDKDMAPYGAAWEERGVKEELRRKGERIDNQEGQHKKDDVHGEGDTYQGWWRPPTLTTAQ